MPTYRPGKAAEQVEREHGIANAIKLASNEHVAAPIDPIIEAISAAATGINRYADHRATPVRAALAAALGVTPQHVTVGSGSVAILQQLFLAFVEPGDEVVYPWRSFEVYPVFTSLMDGVSIRVPLAPDLGVDVDAVVDAVTERTKLIMVATPNNPTGVAATAADLVRLCDNVDPGVVICVDEAYHEFRDPGFGDTVSELIGRFDNVVITRTFSKAHGLAGLRVGYAIAAPGLVSTIDKTALPFGVNALAQAAALAAIDHNDVIAKRVQETLAERARVEIELSAAGYDLPNHQGNFVWLATAGATNDIAVALERSGVVVRPFAGEGIRATIGSPADNDRFLAALAIATRT